MFENVVGLTFFFGWWPYFAITPSSEHYYHPAYLSNYLDFMPLSGLTASYGDTNIGELHSLSSSGMLHMLRPGSHGGGIIPTTLHLIDSHF